MVSIVTHPQAEIRLGIDTARIVIISRRKKPHPGVVAHFRYTALSPLEQRWNRRMNQ